MWGPGAGTSVDVQYVDLPVLRDYSPSLPASVTAQDGRARTGGSAGRLIIDAGPATGPPALTRRPPVGGRRITRSPPLPSDDDHLP